MTIHFYNYEYQANRLKQFSSNDEYTEKELRIIKKTSPFRVMSQIVPKDEKILFLKRFSNVDVSKNKYRQFLTLLNLNDMPEFVKKKNFDGFKKIFFLKIIFC